MLGGMLQRLGYRISRERITQSLVRIDPVQRVFQRIQSGGGCTVFQDQILCGIMMASMVCDIPD
jgi:hypothetical protein